MIHVLLIEEDPEQKEAAYRCIYQYDKDAIIDWVLNGAKAKDTLQCSRYDIVLIHFEAPGICENEIWKYMNGAPVMIFTTLPNVDKELFCFEKGAADYIIKPYNPQIAIARGKRLLEKQGKRFGDLKIDYENNRVILSDKEIILSPIELKFLFTLSKSDKGLSFEELSKIVWGYDEPDLNCMRVLVSKINKKINGKIESVRNWGYKIKQ